MKEEIIYLQNMDSTRDILLVSRELERLGFQVKGVTLGAASFLSSGAFDQQGLMNALNNLGYRVLGKEEKDFAEQVKKELAGYLQLLSKTKAHVPLMSAFLEAKMGVAYASISKRFRRIEERTIENYLISLKVKKIKKLIHSTNLSMEEIAHCLNYSSSRSLARVFREATGFSVHDLKNKRKEDHRLAAGF